MFRDKFEEDAWFLSNFDMNQTSSDAVIDSIDVLRVDSSSHDFNLAMV